MATKAALLYGLGAALSIVGAQMLALWANLVVSGRAPVFANSVLIPAVVVGVTGVLLARAQLLAQRVTD